MLNRTFYIYRYWITLDGKEQSYVGQTHKTRAVRGGKRETLSGYSRTTKFGKALDKYLPVNFQYEELETGLTQDEAWEREKYWIQFYDSIDNGFNTASGGKGNSYRHSEEHKRKISASLKGVFLNRADRSKPVQQFTKENVLIAEYPSIHEAARQTGFMREHIRDCCVGRRKSTGGSIFKYKEN